MSNQPTNTTANQTASGGMLNNSMEGKAGQTTMFIVTETKNGKAFPHNVFACNDEADFIGRIRATQLQHRSGDDLVETVEQACEWLNECYAQQTAIITKEEFNNTESWSSAIDEVALSIGWIEQQEEAGN